jgi:hypothetical protein
MFYYIDKTSVSPGVPNSVLTSRTLSYAALFGIRKDLNLTGTQYSTLSSIFYVGWLVWAIPGNLLLPKFPVSKYLAINVRWICSTDTDDRSSYGEYSLLRREELGIMEIWWLSV